MVRRASRPTLPEQVDYLADLLAALPPSAKQPTPEDIAIMRRIDGIIDDVEDALSWAYGESYAPAGERKILETLAIGSCERFNHLTGTHYGLPITRPVRAVQAEHDMRVSLIRRDLPEGVVLEDGGIKSRDRSHAKLKAWGDLVAKGKRNITDLSRVRLIGETLGDVDIAYLHLHNTLANANFFEISFGTPGYPIMDNHNHSKTNLPFRAIQSCWGRLQPHADTPIKRIVTEVQVMTRNTRALLDISHPFALTESVPYPSSAHWRWLFDLFLKSALDDVRTQEARNATQPR